MGCTPRYHAPCVEQGASHNQCYRARRNGTILPASSPPEEAKRCANLPPKSSALVVSRAMYLSVVARDAWRRVRLTERISSPLSTLKRAEECRQLCRLYFSGSPAAAR